MEAVKHLRQPDLQAPWQQHTLVLPPAAHLLALPNAQSCALLLLHPDPATTKYAVSKVAMQLLLYQSSYKMMDPAEVQEMCCHWQINDFLSGDNIAVCCQRA